MEALEGSAGGKSGEGAGEQQQAVSGMPTQVKIITGDQQPVAAPIFGDHEINREHHGQKNEEVKGVEQHGIYYIINVNN